MILLILSHWKSVEEFKDLKEFYRERVVWKKLNDLIDEECLYFNWEKCMYRVYKMQYSKLYCFPLWEKK